MGKLDGVFIENTKKLWYILFRIQLNYLKISEELL